MKTGAALLAASALAACAAGPRPDGGHGLPGASAVPSTIIATELAFAREAQARGTWTAFRRYATDDAVWPGPNWENVQSALKGQADPAQAIVWEPDRVVLSCDGSFALSTGPATYPSGKRSRFATVWQRQDDGSYRWVLDQGFDLEPGYARPEMIAAEVADCPAGARGRPQSARRGLAWQSGQSDDASLTWTTDLRADCSRELVVRARRGSEIHEVFRGTSAPPPSPPGDRPQEVCA